MTDTSFKTSSRSKAVFKTDGQYFTVLRQHKAARPLIVDAQGKPLTSESMPKLEIGYKPEAMFGLARYAGPVIYNLTGEFLHHLYVGDIQFHDTWERCKAHFNTLDFHPEYKALIKKFGDARFPSGRQGINNELLLMYHNKDMLDICLPENNTMMWGDEINLFDADCMRMSRDMLTPCYSKNSVSCFARPVWRLKRPRI